MSQDDRGWSDARDIAPVERPGWPTRLFRNAPLRLIVYYGAATIRCRRATL